MKRYGFLLALGIVAASPAGASAFFRCWCAPPAYGPYAYGYAPYAGPIFRPRVVPIYVAPPPMIYPAYPSIPPAVAPKAQAPMVPLQAPVVTITPGIVSPMAKPETDTLIQPISTGVATPMPAPAPMIPDPMVPPKAPPLVLPPIPGSDAKPMSPIPSAVPMPAPASSGLSIPLTEPRKVPNGKEELPPLVLPPETPGGPSGVIPSISPSSPLTGAVKVQVFRANGTPLSPELRKIGFFNHTDRDVDLVIEGKAVKLPKKSFLNAELPVKFTWKHSGGTAEIATVPEGAAGLDVLFKE